MKQVWLAATLQFLAPPCDIPGLTQEQYSTCMEHTLCYSMTLHITSALEKKWAYNGCLAKHEYYFEPSNWHWIIEPDHK
jgi:hypothetical protein